MKIPKLLKDAIGLSSYHFDKDRIDPKFDCFQILGRFEENWMDEVNKIIAETKPRSLGNLLSYQVEDHYKEMYKINDSDWNKRNIPKNVLDDLTQDVDIKQNPSYLSTPIINKTSRTEEIGPKITALFNAFKLTAPVTYSVHVQKFGQVFPYHVDVFHRREWKDSPQDKIIRIQVMLNDWSPGQVLGYGNSVYTHWKAGEFHTFDHVNVPHWTANANYQPRVSLLITGVKTEETEDFLGRAKKLKTIKLN
jgi:hypothetical protein